MARRPRYRNFALLQIRRKRSARWRLEPGKFIPSSDRDFAQLARSFAAYVEHDPDAYKMSEDEVAEVVDAVAGYRAALAKTLWKPGCTPLLTKAKERARK